MLATYLKLGVFMPWQREEPLVMDQVNTVSRPGLSNLGVGRFGKVGWVGFNGMITWVLHRVQWYRGGISTWRGDAWRGDNWLSRTWRSDSWHGNSWRSDSWCGNTWRGDTWRSGSWRNESWRSNTLRGNTWRGNTWLIESMDICFMSSGSVLDLPAFYMTLLHLTMLNTTLLNTTMLNTIMLNMTMPCPSMSQRYVLVKCEVEVECRNPRSWWWL